MNDDGTRILVAGHKIDQAFHNWKQFYKMSVTSSVLSDPKFKLFSKTNMNPLEWGSARTPVLLTPDSANRIELLAGENYQVILKIFEAQHTSMEVV